MFADVHCHLDDQSYGDVGALVARCNERGIVRLVTAGFDLASSERGRALAEKYESVYFTAGFHPTELKGYREGDLNAIAELLSHPKCVALGEIGLDYHYPDTDKKAQTEMFIRQLALAHENKMPVQIHSRDCAEDMLGILRKNAHLLEYGALMHCYSHSAEIAAELEKLGIYFSFGGASTWKGSKRANKAIALLPADRLLTETDSPYMPPASLYGTFPNTPLSIPEIAAHIADCKGIPRGEFEDMAYSNVLRLFPAMK